MSKVTGVLTALILLELVALFGMLTPPPETPDGCAPKIIIVRKIN